MEPWVDLTPPHPQAPGTEPADPVRSRRFLQPSAAAHAGRMPLSGHRLSPLQVGDRPSRAASSNDHHPSKENVMSKRLSTQVDIEATPERVWEVLTDLAAYPEWNPFIVRAAGDVAPGRRLTLRMQPVGGRAMTLRPRLVEVAVHRELRWRGKLVVPGLMDAEHAFVLQPQAGGTRLIHRETFRGVLVPFAAASLDRNTLPAFVAMNEALRRRAEDPARPRARTGAVDDRGTRS
jgi:hypothetical protein